DIIFCRYVLIYFSQETKQKVFRDLWNVLNSNLENNPILKDKVFRDLWNVLNPGGYLILGATEIAPVSFPDI
ncbi:MAG: MCP methyltransferase, CheR-type, partial [Thermodesulfobacterium commune]